MRSLFLIIASTSLLFACSSKSSKKHIQVNPGFSTYVNAFTSGVISSQSSIKLILTAPNPKAKPGDMVEPGLLQFEPSLNGQAVWVDQQTIEFKPSENLKSGKSYVGSFHLHKLMEVPSEFKTMDFSFTIIAQSLFVNVEGLKAEDIKDLTQQQLKGSIRTSDKTKAENLEQCLKATQDGNALEIIWTHTDNSKTHEYLVKGIKRGKKESFVELVWNGEPIGAEIENDREIRVPPLGEFTLLQVNTLRKPSLHFSVLFSDPVKSSQDLTGLIYLKSGKNLRLVINANEVKAYPTENLSSQEIVLINNTIKNMAGNQLQSSYERTVQFNLTNPAIELIGKGVIMPSGNSVSFPFRAVNLKAVNLRIVRIFEENVPQFLQRNQLDGYSELTRVGRLIYDGSIDLVSEEPLDYGVWNNFSIDLSKYINQEPGAIYRVLLNFERYQSLYPCGDGEEAIKQLKKHQPNQNDGNSYYSDWDWYEGHYNWDEKDNPCSDSYYQYRDRGLSANIVASNLGIIAKESANLNYDVVITDLKSTDPLNGIEVTAYNYQNQPVGTGRTNGDGLASIKTEVKPYLIVAKQGNQKGYLRVDNGSALSMSLYDVGGKQISNGIKGYIYGERGVWRPGDTIHLSFMLEDKQQILPESHPVVLELFDPKGKLYDKQVSTKGVQGLYYFKLKTEQKDITGAWRAKVSVGNSTFFKSLKVETIKPNRIKINYDMAEVMPSNKRISTQLNAQWLYGSPGANLKARMEMVVENMKTTFKNYNGYQFDDRTKRFWDSDNLTKEQTTDAVGNANFTFNFEKPRSAPGMLKMKFRTKVFEQGGDFSQDFLSTKYSPYRSYVGIKLDKGQNWIKAINSEETTPIALASVDEFGNPIDRKVLVEVFRLKWNWWWEGNGSDEVTQYIRAYSKTLIASSSYSIKEGQGIFDLEFDNPVWGRFLIKVSDLESGHSASQIMFARYPGWYDMDDNGADAASMLSIESTKPYYNVGEEIELSVPSGGVGKIYVTVEKGDRILQQFWVKAESNTTRFGIPSTAEMAPNVYVSATLIQPHGQDDNSLPIRMFGLIPITVNDPETHVIPQLATPKAIKPESTFEVKVNEKNGKAMAYSLAVVDEGLLSITRFKTPNPWNTFYSKEALGIRTWDMYKYVMSAKTGKLTPLLAVGGDQGLEYKEDEKANRFKPVVRYLGPFFLKAGETQKHQVDIPNYIGAVRVMAVTGYQGAYGNGEKEVLVKQPLMVLSTLPRVLGPSEKIRVPINVICMSDKLKSVNVKISTNSLLKPSASNQTVSFEKAGDKTVYFDIDVAKQLGVAKFKVEVSSGNEYAFEEIELLVRAPNPHINQSENKAIAQGQKWSTEYEAFGIKGSNAATLTISKIPDLGLEKHLKYLIRYPHGCIEQTTSSVFPQLFLSRLTKLSAQTEEEIHSNIVAGLNGYRQFQLPSGGFSYWPGSSDYASDWGTNYAFHFILEAKTEGYTIPSGMEDRLISYQRERAANWNRSSYTHWSYHSSDLVQAYRLYTLALAGKEDVGAMNRLKSDPKLSKTGRWRLAAAYAVIGRTDAAKELVTDDTNIEAYRETGYSYGSHIRDWAMMIETLHYMKDFDRASSLIKDMSEQLKDGWHSTQTRAYALLAVAKFIGTNAPTDNYSFTVNVNGENKSISTSLPYYQFELPKHKLPNGTIWFDNTSNQTLFLSWVQSGIPLEIEQQSLRKDLGMNVTYTDMSGYPIDVSKLKQGQDFKAKVIVTHPGLRANYQEIALNQIFPSGWQIINTRVAEEVAVQNNFQFQDIRDDRVYTYFSLRKNKSKTFEILLNATYVGKYYMPGVFCAPMYDESIQALDGGKWVEVVEGQ